MKSKFPIKVRRGSVAVTIYHQQQENVFTVEHYVSGQRKRRSFVDIGRARKEAEEIAERLARGEVGNLVARIGKGAKCHDHTPRFRAPVKIHPLAKTFPQLSS